MFSVSVSIRLDAASSWVEFHTFGVMTLSFIFFEDLFHAECQYVCCPLYSKRAALTGRDFRDCVSWDLNKDEGLAAVSRKYMQFAFLFGQFVGVCFSCFTQ